MLELHGANVVQRDLSETVHYIVVTAGGFPHHGNAELVSRSFVDDCIESQRLLAVEYYHLPLLLPGSSFPLEDCCITVSTYAKYERNFLEHMLILLGAQNQENFSKTSKADKNILANTHLLCPTPTGAKYNAAKKWRIPAVTCDWLIECARSSQKVPEKNYLVGCSSSTNPHPSRKAIIRALWDSAVDVERNMKETKSEEDDDEVPATPAVRKVKSLLTLDTLSPDRPFDREAVSRMYPTPGTTRFYQTRWEAELDAMPVPDSPFGLTFYDDPPPRVRKVLKYIIDSTLEPDPSKISDTSKSNEMDDLLRDFMDTVRQDLTSSRTKCRSKNPELMEVIDQNRGKSNRGTEEKDGRGDDNDADSRNECPNGGVNEEEERGDENNAVVVNAGKKLTHQLEEIARASLVERSGGIAGKSKVAPLSERHKPTTPSKRRHIDLESQPNEEVEPLATQITWNDPEENLARLSLQDNMQEETHTFSPIKMESDANHMNSDDDGSNKENIPSGPQQDKPPVGTPQDRNKVKIIPSSTTNVKSSHPVFLLVGMGDKEVKEYTKMVVQLGGEVSCSQTLEAHVTHLVAKMLSRSERTLMSIVSGRWVLMASFLQHSLEAGHFLKEEPYAWGNASSEHHPNLQPKSIQSKLAQAAWRWKCAMSEMGAGKQPFQNMKALIHTRKDRAKAFSRLIEAGGGLVVSARPPYSEVEGITHFFVEMEKSHEKIDLGSFASRGIPCLQPIFINSCIMEDAPESDFYIPEYKDILANMSSCVPSPLKRAQRN